MENNIEQALKTGIETISKLRQEKEMLLDALKEITEMAEKWSVKGLTPTIFKAQQAIKKVEP